MNCDELKSILQEKSQRIQAIIKESEKAKKEAEAELETINNDKLPSALAHQILEPASMVEVARWKRRRAKLQAIIADYPMLIRGLGVEQAKDFVLRRRLERYQTVKDQLQSNYDADLEKRLIEMARTIDCLDDAEEFIRSLKKRVSLG